MAKEILEYQSFLKKVDLEDSYKKSVSEDVFTRLAIFCQEKTTTPEVFLGQYKKDSLGFLGKFFVELGLCKDSIFDNENSVSTLSELGLLDSSFLENCIAAYSCYALWKRYIDEYNLKNKLFNKTFDSNFSLLLTEGKGFEKDVVDNLNNLSEVITLSMTDKVEDDNFFIEEYKKLVSLEEILSQKDLSVLTQETIDLIGMLVRDNLMPQMKKVLSYCFDDIPTYVLTPQGIYGSTNRDKRNEIQNIDYLPYASNKATVDAVCKFSYKYWNMAMAKGNLTNTIDNGFSDEYINNYGSKCLIMNEMGGSESEKLNFPFKIKEFFKYFMFPYMNYNLINKNAFKVKEIGGDLGSSYQIEYDNLHFEDKGDFFNQLETSYIDLISILLKDFILTKEELDIKCIRSDYIQKRNSLENIDIQNSNFGVGAISAVVEAIIHKLVRITYTLSDLEKGSKNPIIDIVGSLFIDSKYDSAKAESGKDSYFTGMSGLQDMGAFSNVKKLAENVESGQGFYVFRGIYTIDIQREANELLFAYKKYDNLFYNKKPLGANFILGRDEETRMPVVLPLNVPQNIITAIIAGSGAGKGVLTLAALANLYVGEHSVIYADFKPDMGATLWDIAKNANTPIYSIDGKDLQTQAGIVPYNGENNEYGVSMTIDNNTVPVDTINWHGYDSYKNNFVQSYLGLDAVKIIPYLKTMQLFVALGLARKSCRKKLKNMKSLNGSTVSDNGKKMFLILDEAQLANTIYDGIITELIGKIKSKPDDETLKNLERFKYVFVDKLAKEMKDVVITTGRVSKMGIILIGQQVDPGQWATPQGSWKECTFGYMIGNAAIKLIGNNGGTSPTYGMPEKFSKSKDSNVGKTLGYWAYSTQVRSGKDEKAKGLKTYLILNKNDYNVAAGPEGNQDGEFTAGLFTSRPDETARYQLAQDLTTDESLQHIRENVGFDGMLKQFLNDGQDLDANGYSQNYKDKVSYTYYLYESFLLTAGIIGPDTEYPNLFSYLFSVNPESFYTAGELYESFKDGKSKKLSEDSGNVNVLEFLTPFAVFDDKDGVGLLYNEDENSEQFGSVIKLKMTFSDLEAYANPETNRLHKYYLAMQEEMQQNIKDLQKQLESETNEEVKENISNAIKKYESNLSILAEGEQRDLAIFKEILNKTTKEKFEKIPIEPEYVRDPYKGSSQSSSDNSVSYTVTLNQIKSYVDKTIEQNSLVFYKHSNGGKCLEVALNKYSMSFPKKLKDVNASSKATSDFNMGNDDIQKTFEEIYKDCEKHINSADASDETKDAGIAYLTERVNNLKSVISDKFKYAYDNGTLFVVGGLSVKEEPKEEPQQNTGGSDSSDGGADNNNSNPDNTELKPPTFEDTDSFDNMAEEVKQQKLNALYSTYDSRFRNSFQTIDKELSMLGLKRSAKGELEFEAYKSKFKNLIMYWENIKEIKSFFTALEKEPVEKEIIEIAVNKYKEDYKTKMQGYMNQADSLVYTGKDSKPEVPAQAEEYKNPNHKAQLNGRSVDTDLSDESKGLVYNIDNTDSWDNVKASSHLTQIVIKDIKKQFGGLNGIETISVTANGCLAINSYTYSPKFDESFMDSLGAAIRHDVEDGQLYKVVNIGRVINAISTNIYELAIETPKVACNDVFKKEMGIKGDNYGVLFKTHNNLQTIYLPDNELNRNNPQQQQSSGGGLGSKLARIFGFGGNRNSGNYVPNPAPSYEGNDMVDRIFDSKPVRVLTGALGWTLGCKAVVMAATIFGPWGLLFGAFAAVGAYNSMKEDRNNYSSNNRNNGSNGNYRNNSGNGSNGGNKGKSGSQGKNNKNKWN